ncbi:MAG: radical SAM/SPASM domain-containing protein [Acidobacteriota bacterium]
MLIPLARRVLAETDPKVIGKFVYNFGVKGIRSVERHKRRLARGEYFPPFLFISVISGCQLRCQGCWVDVAAPSKRLAVSDLSRIVRDAQRHGGNSYFGILGGEPFLHPELLEFFAAHPDCYFQVFTNGQLITDAVAAELRRLGNVTPLISIEGTEAVSDSRRGRLNVLNRTLAGLEACRRNRLLIGVATSVCQTNIDLVSEPWLRRLVELGVHYVWFHTYRVVGPKASPDLALRPEQVVAIRRFVVQMRSKVPLAIVDAYWDDKGEALCPMATGISHHISPYGDVEPCPIIQFARETIHDRESLYETMTQSDFLRDFRATAAGATRGCVVLERPDLVRNLVVRHGARDTTQRQTALAELESLQARGSQHNPGHEVPEDNWAYRFAKKHWFFGFGAYT